MTPHQQIEATLETMAPEIREAFLDRIAGISSPAQLNLIAGHLVKGDTKNALIALNLRPEFLAPLDRALDRAYRAGVVVTLAKSL